MNVVRQIVFFLLLMLIQMLVFNNLHFMGLCHPFVYLLFLISLPIMPRWAEMLVGLATGFVMDVVCSTLGMHMAACVLVGWLRPLLLSKLVQESQRITQPITSLSIGWVQYIRLSVVLTLAHHGVVFLMDAWSISHPLLLLLRWVISTAVSLLFILGYNLTKQR